MLIQPLGHSLFSAFWLVQLANLILIALAVRLILKYLWRTPAMPVVLMFMVLLLLANVLGSLGFYTIAFLLHNLTPLLFIAVVVIFHEEIRDLLGSMGRNLQRRFSDQTGVLEKDVIGTLVESCMLLKRRHLGGLFVIERQESLGRVYRVPPVELDKVKIEPSIIAALLQPPGLLHDGAIIIKNGEIVGARAILPLSKSIYLPRQGQSRLRGALGTRHRAALGITEVSDAIALVVSEETGVFSLAVNGILEEGLSSEQLTERLAELTVSRKED